MPIEDKLRGEDESPFVTDSDVHYKEIKAVPAPERSFGIDTKDSFFNNIANTGLTGGLDINKLESFTSITLNRNTVYSLLDTMTEDAIISAVLETYAEDATEYNDQGQIVWVESSQPEILKYVQFLLDTMNVDKNIYKWVYALCKYGDVYLRL